MQRRPEGFDLAEDRVRVQHVEDVDLSLQPGRRGPELLGEPNVDLVPAIEVLVPGSISGTVTLADVRFGTIVRSTT